MAKKTIELLVDDIDGSEAEETIKFAFDGVIYEIDVNSANAKKFRTAMGKYVGAAAKVGRLGAHNGSRVPAQRASSRGPATVDRDQNRAIRDWAQAKGIPVSDRGRIKQEVVDRYHAEAGR